VAINKPVELLPLFQQRIWGKTSLAPLFPNQVDAPDPSTSVRIGEVWFSFIENPTSAGETLGELLKSHPEWLGEAANPQYPGVCPILLKLLFTTERLSVQVHPDDAYALAHHQSLGKTEAWYVLEAEPPGEVAVGFRDELTPERFRESIASGEIENLLDWRKAKAGDVIFTPAGTVHAIGAGLTVCEIQENSDITYRLYDYGRARELHIDDGARVSHLGPHRNETRPITLAAGRDELVACEYFRIERLRPRYRFELRDELPYYAILVCVSGRGRFDGQACRAGQAWFIPAGSEAAVVEAPGSEWILTYTSRDPTEFVQVE
jgi:mannose-6-phosphate isomerase